MMYSVFSGCSGLTSIDVSGWGTSNVTDMNHMFHNCAKLTSLDVSNFNTAKVTAMHYMFASCYNLTTIYAGKLWTNNAVTKSTGMFYNSTKLRGAIAYDSTKLDANYANYTTGYFINKADIGVYANLYKISDTEYHLIYNSTGAIAEGYTNEQLVVRGRNIKAGSGCYKDETTGEWKSIETWEPYSANITKAKIEEPIKPTGTGCYFFGLSKITEIEEIENLDTSNVTSMKDMFCRCESLTSIDVSNFNTSNVKSMWGMFANCKSLTDLELGDFDTSNVTTMHQMFNNCTNLTNVDVSGFDTSNVTDMTRMFCNDYKLTSLDVSNWNTSKVTNMESMFEECKIPTSIDVSNFDTSNVTNMKWMFLGCENLINLDVSGWDTGKVTNMYSMFLNCYNLTELDVSGWNTNNVTSMFQMFYNCQKLENLDIGGFDTSNVTDMTRMFCNNYKLTNLDVSNWNTGKVTTMESMFEDCDILTSIDVSNFDTSNVTNMKWMFYACNDLTTIYASDKWTISAVTESTDMFKGSTKLRGAIAYDSTKLDANYANYTTGYFVNKADIGVYANLYKISDTEYHLIYNSTGAIADGYTNSQLVARGTNVVDGSGRIVGAGEEYISSQPWGEYSNNIKKVKIEERIQPNHTGAYFVGLSQITEIEGLENLDVSNVTGMTSMFEGCSNLERVDVGDWDTNNVTAMDRMFFKCGKLTSIDVSNWNISKVSHLGEVFNYCNNLKDIDVSKWDTSNVIKMWYVFSNCNNLTSVDVSGWDTSNVQNMSGLFNGCYNITTIDVSDWDTSSVISMQSMFGNCSNITSLDVSNWDTSNVTNMKLMFYNCPKLTTIYASDKWTVSAVTESELMFQYSTKLRGAIAYDPTKLDANYANYTTGYFVNKADIGVYGNLYKISDTEYHLILNSTGAIAEGYTNSQLVARGTNVVDGSDYVLVSEGVYQSNQPWGPYSDNITKVKVEEKIAPRSALRYFYAIPNITEIEGLSNIDTSNATSMVSMFDGCSSITSLDLSGFDTSNVTSMNSMFEACRKLTTIDTSNWDTSNVTSMYDMFANCPSLSSVDVSKFDTSKVTNMGYMFHNCSSLTNIDVTRFNTRNVTNMEFMFYNCASVTSLDLSGFDTSKVTNMQYMFYNCDGLTSIDVSSFDTSEVSNMNGVFYGCTTLTTIYASDRWNNSAMTTSTNMFYGSTKLKGAIAYDSTKLDANYANSSNGYFINKANVGVYSNLYKISDTEYHLIFNSTGAIADGYTNSQLVVRGTNIKNGAGAVCDETTGLWKSTQPWEPYSDNITNVKIVEKIEPTSMACYFFGLSAVTEIEGMGNLDTSKVTNMQDLFYKCSSLTSVDVSGFDTSNVTDMQMVFFYCSSLTSVDLSNWNTSNVWRTRDMFAGCHNLSNLDVSGFDTSKVTDMYEMFSGCKMLTNLDVGNFDTSKVTTMQSMFYDCINLTSLDVSGFDTSNVTDMIAMFYSCKKLTNIDVSGFNTSNVTGMRNMFSGCTNLINLDLSNFDTSKVTTMQTMFANCKKLSSLNLTSFKTNNVTNMYRMFYGSNGIEKIYVSDKWTTNAVTSGDEMFYNCTKLSGAIPFDSTKLGHAYANYEAGYLTLVDIPIYTSAQLLKMGSGESVNVAEAGKTYQFSEGKTYLINNDITFTGDYSAIATKIKNGKIKVVGNDTIKVTNASGVNEYYTENSKYHIATNKYGYVLNGLQVHYDGIDNTGSGHSLTTAKWKDLSGKNNDGTLKGKTTVTSADWAGNGLVLDGSDDWVSIGAMNYDNVTLEIVVSNAEVKTSEVIYMGNFESGGYGLRYYTAEDSLMHNGMLPYIVGKGYSSLFASNQVIANKKYSLSGSYDGATIVLRENEERRTTAVAGEIGETTGGTYFVIGGNPGGTSAVYGGLVKGTVYSARVYNRALTAEEQEVNYKADQIRYGV